VVVATVSWSARSAPFLYSLDLTRQSLHHPGVDRRGFLLTSLAGALAGPLAIEPQQADAVATVG
jgi:hypothetical protein